MDLLNQRYLLHMDDLTNAEATAMKVAFDVIFADEFKEILEIQNVITKWTLEHIEQPIKEDDCLMRVDIKNSLRRRRRRRRGEFNFNI